MAKVTGIGGVFFKVADPAATRAWYARHLGLESKEWGAKLPASGVAVWNPFATTSTHFGPGDQPFMVNLKVDNLDALLVELRASGIELVGEPTDDGFGKFAWIRDCDGFKVELWQPPA